MPLRSPRPPQGPSAGRPGAPSPWPGTCDCPLAEGVRAASAAGLVSASASARASGQRGSVRLAGFKAGAKAVVSLGSCCLSGLQIGNPLGPFLAGSDPVPTAPTLSRPPHGVPSFPCRPRHLLAPMATPRPEHQLSHDFRPNHNLTTASRACRSRQPFQNPVQASGTRPPVSPARLPFRCSLDPQSNASNLIIASSVRYSTIVALHLPRLCAHSQADRVKLDLQVDDSLHGVLSSRIPLLHPSKPPFPLPLDTVLSVNNLPFQGGL